MKKIMNPSIKVLNFKFRDFCTTNLINRQIDDIFLNAGFSKSETFISSGKRRELVEEYYASANWE